MEQTFNFSFFLSFYCSLSLFLSLMNIQGVLLEVKFLLKKEIYNFLINMIRVYDEKFLKFLVLQTWTWSAYRLKKIYLKICFERHVVHEF